MNLDLPGGAGSVTDINGALFAVDGGILGQLAADLDLTTSDLALSGSSALAFNSTASAFQGTLNAGDSSVPVDVPAGPYFAFGLTDLDFSLLGSTVTGDVTVVLSQGLIGESGDAVEVEVDGSTGDLATEHDSI